MSPDPGWYHAQGDPVDTVRRWNGEQWIGFPIKSPDTAAGPVGIAGAKPFTPIPGQVGLEGISMATKVVLAGVMAAYAYLGYVIYLNDKHIPTGPFDPGPTPIPQAVTVMAVAAFLGGLLFIGWFSLAYRNLSRWHSTRREPGWATVVFFTPFVQFRWPWDMMLELVEQSGRPERQGEISPFAVLGWWVGWTFHQTLFWASLGLNRWDLGGRSSHTIAMAACGVALVGLSFGIYLVHVVSAAQETRRRPTKAQRAAMATA